MKGFACPKGCGPTEVKATRTPCRGRVVRYRRCPKCGHQTRTEEHEARSRRPSRAPLSY